MDKEYIYLDYAANTPVDPEILETFNKATLNITNDGKEDLEQLKSLLRQDTILVSI